MYNGLRTYSSRLILISLFYNFFFFCVSRFLPWFYYICFCFCFCHCHCHCLCFLPACVLPVVSVTRTLCKVRREKDRWLSEHVSVLCAEMGWAQASSPYLHSHSLSPLPSTPLMGRVMLVSHTLEPKTEFSLYERVFPFSFLLGTPSHAVPGTPRLCLLLGDKSIGFARVHVGHTMPACRRCGGKEGEKGRVRSTKVNADG